MWNIHFRNSRIRSVSIDKFYLTRNYVNKKLSDSYLFVVTHFRLLLKLADENKAVNLAAGSCWRRCTNNAKSFLLFVKNSNRIYIAFFTLGNHDSYISNVTAYSQTSSTRYLDAEAWTWNARVVPWGFHMSFQRVISKTWIVSFFVVPWLYKRRMTERYAYAKMIAKLRVIFPSNGVSAQIKTFGIDI